MDRNKFSKIGHTHHKFYNPITENKFEKILNLVNLNAFDKIVVIGEGYWKVKPSSEYLDALGADESELNSHYGNIKLAEELGLISLWSTVASEDDWDEYECLYSMSIENYCFKHPEDEDCLEMIQKIRSWRKTYFSMGRDTLGFGLYLFRNIK
jgi:hypothetical protein